jgi:hypothetical protein
MFRHNRNIDAIKSLIFHHEEIRRPTKTQLSKLNPASFGEQVAQSFACSNAHYGFSTDDFKLRSILIDLVLVNILLD